MKLDTEIWPPDVSDTFVATIIGIDEQLFPAIGQCLRVYCITVILRCNVALPGEQTCAGNVGTTVTEFHFQCVGARSSSKQLMPQANSEDWRSCLIHCGLDVLHGIFHHCWITRAVGDEQAVVFLAGKLREIVVPWYL
jgi:hypothetical protein